MKKMTTTPRVILQICHCHYAPFDDVARQGVSLFNNTGARVVTVFLTGAKSESIRQMVGGDEVIFLEFSSKAIAGLKRDAIRRVREIAQRIQPELCVAHRWKSVYVACHLKTIPVIGVHHRFGDLEHWTRRWFANRHRERLTLLGVSDAVRDNIRKSLPRWHTDRIQTLYNRIDIKLLRERLFAREEARQQLGIAPEEWIIGNVGRLHTDKDQASLLRAFARAQLPAAARLLILGKGPLEVELKQLSETLGIAHRVRFAGHVPEASRLFSAFDIFALSSPSEPFGMVLLEAMAAGVPIVTTRAGGAIEVVGDTATQVSERDIDAFAYALVATSELSSEQRNNIASAMDKRLQSLFSDQAVQAAFWQLPTIRAALT